MTNNSIAQNLEYNKNNWLALKQALEDKGIDTTGLTCAQMVALVDDITPVNNTNVNVTPSTSSQQITPTAPYTGFDEVNVSAVDSTIDSNIKASNIKEGVTILGVQGSFVGSNDIKEEFSKSKEYSDNSPVTYEWTLSSITDNIVITNDNEGGGVWNKPTSSNIVVSIKRDNNDVYTDLVEGTDYTLTVTGSTRGNYIYTIEIHNNEFIYSVKVVFTDIYRVRGRLDCNKIYKITYDTVAPSSTTGIEKGEQWYVYNGEGQGAKVTQQYMFNGTRWIKLNAGYNFSLDILTHPISVVSKRAVFEYNGKLQLVSDGKHYEYDNGAWTLINTNSELLADCTHDSYNLGMVIKDKLYWIKNSASGHRSVGCYDLSTHVITTIANSFPAGFVSCAWSDGVYLYGDDYNANKIFKIDISARTDTYIMTGLTRSYYQIVEFKGELYGISNLYLDKIDITNETVTNVYIFTGSQSTDVYMSLVSSSDYLFIIGGRNDVGKVYAYDGTNVIDYDTLDGIHKKNIDYIFDSVLYEVGTTDSASGTEYKNTFKQIGIEFKKDIIVDATAGTEIDTTYVGKVKLV